MRKLRPDSTIGNLPPYLKDEVDEMLLTGQPYRAIQERLVEDGIKLSITSISEYYKSQIYPAKLARQNRTVEALKKISLDGMDEATMQALRERLFELAMMPGGDVQSLKIIAGILKDADEEKFTVGVQKKVKTEGSKRPKLVEEDETFTYEQIKYTKYLISFK